MIHHDNRLWKRNFKLGHLPGDIYIGDKIELFDGKPIAGHDEKVARSYRKEIIKKANRRFRHSFKNEELKQLIDELDNE